MPRCLKNQLYRTKQSCVFPPLVGCFLARMPHWHMASIVILSYILDFGYSLQEVWFWDCIYSGHLRVALRLCCLFCITCCLDFHATWPASWFNVAMRRVPVIFIWIFKESNQGYGWIVLHGVDYFVSQMPACTLVIVTSPETRVILVVDKMSFIRTVPAWTTTCVDTCQVATFNVARVLLTRDVT